MAMNKLDPQRIDAHRRAQAEYGFTLLKNCPNTSAVHLVRIFERMNPNDLNELFDEWAKYDLLDQSYALSSEEHQKQQAQFPAIAKLRDAKGHALSDRTISTLPVKVVAGSVNDPAVGGTTEAWAAYLHLPTEAAEFTTLHATAVEDLVPIPPRSLRIKLRKSLADRFDAVEERLSTETTRYTGQSSDWKIAVDVTFVSNRGWRRQHQFNYGIWLGPISGGRLHIQGYEALWGIQSEWDYITVENADRSLAALCDLVEVMIDLTA